MQDIISAVREKLGPSVTIVPIGDVFPGGVTEEAWGGPHLVRYYTWAQTRDRRSQLALLHHLNKNFNVLGAIGMRSGVTDQFAFAGIRTISIDITPFQNRGALGEGTMLDHPRRAGIAA
ncbi:hypothetical protein GXW82_41750 [Streptacidiphilus sp. 4-A2]|nr:hypothetical protein [Streptacidiphilus sp. 4-A2]